MDKVQNFIKTGIEEGATLIAGGLGRLQRLGFWILRSDNSFFQC